MVNGAGLPKDLSAEEFSRFRDYIQSHSGIYLEDGKRDSLRISLVTRATRHSFRSYDEYFRLLAADPDEFKELLNLITINETSFFRFPAQFEALRAHVLPEIMRTRGAGSGQPLRVWSAGCSTGEEPYSLAIALIEAGVEALGWKPHVLGTDVSTAALSAARRGVYPAKALLNVPGDLVDRHFEEVAEGFRVRKNTRRVTEFAYQNLIKEPYPLSLMGAWDVVFCRNVTIYFRIESTTRVVANFFRMLNPGGYLFVGHSETLTNISEDFEAIEAGGVFLYRKPPAKPFTVAPIVVPRAGARERRRPERTRATQAEPSGVPAGSEGREVDEAASFERARNLAAAGEPRQVLDVVARLKDARPDSVEAHLLAAYAHADLGEYADALTDCRAALAVNPLLPSARYILGIIHQRQGDPVGALSELKKTIYIDPDFALAHLNLGNLYKAQHKWDAACRSYENALRSLKSNPEGEWAVFMGGFDSDLLVKTVERSLLECRRAAGTG